MNHGYGVIGNTLKGYHYMYVTSEQLDKLIENKFVMHDNGWDAWYYDDSSENFYETIKTIGINIETA